MSRLTCHTAGESHGPALIALVEALPAGVPVDLDLINGELRRRQGGYGRGGRMKIEHDEVALLSGVRHGRTIGSPVAMQIINRDSRLDAAPPVHRPRPGHADLAGSLKWNTDDCRNTLERASARETAARTAAGALARCLLRELGIEAVGFVTRIGPVEARSPVDAARTADGAEASPAADATAAAYASSAAHAEALRRLRDGNEAYCPDAGAAEAMIAAIRQAKADKDTLGGVVEVHVYGVPPGLGSCARWQDKLDGRLMRAVGSIQAIKGVEIGLGFAAAGRPGSAVQDAIGFDAAGRGTHTLGFTRASNNAGGIEGGMSNGQPIIVRAAMKPISTLLRGMDSVDLRTRAPERADYERSDICAVPAASVVAENVVAFEIAAAFLEKFGGDTLAEVRAAYQTFIASTAQSEPPAEGGSGSG